MLRKIIDYNRGYSAFSTDSMSADLLIKAASELYDIYDAKNNDIYIATIGHPKTHTGGAIQNLDSFISKILNQSNKYQFISLRQIADKFCL